MNVSVISDYSKCESMVNELKLSAGKFKKCIELNTQGLDNPDYERITIKKKRHICGGETEELDAEDYYKSKIEELMFNIRTEEEF